MQVDAWFSMGVFTIATVAFYLLGAAVLHPQGLRPEGPGMLRELSQMYLALGAWTAPAFLVGAWAVLFKTLYVSTAGSSRMSADFLVLSGIWRRPMSPAARTRAVKAFSAFYPTLALALYFIFREPKTLVTIGGFAQALMLPLIAGATLYLRYRDADPRVAPSRASDALTWIAFLALAAVAIYSLVSLAISLVAG